MSHHGKDKKAAGARPNHQAGARVDPIARAWTLCNPAVPFPVLLRRDLLGITSRGMVATA
jgi:hypothetical protein